MFDDIKNQSSAPPASGRADEQDNKIISGDNQNVPAPSHGAGQGGVEDIFADTEKAAAGPSGLARGKPDQPVKPSVFQPKEPSSSDPIPRVEAKEKNKIFAFDVKKFIFLIGIVLVLAVITGGGLYVYSKFFGSDGNLELITDEDISENKSSGKTEEKSDEQAEKGASQNQIQKPQPQVPVQPKDTDRDGLSDEEEKRLGTDMYNTDSDGDMLFDREEVVVYKTDPLNPDTDGDGFLDGAEIQNGYNPKGAGKLYEIK